MKILYIDSRNYGHNRDIHIDFIAYWSRLKNTQIIPYGKYLNHFLSDAILPGDDPEAELTNLVKRHKPDCILTYNCNGSSYEVGLDNVSLYKWAQEFLAKSSLPKFHFTTDFMRSGLREEQVSWFEDLDYTAAFLRHKASLQYDLPVPKYWIPFSIESEFYERHAIKDLKLKKKRVGFLGAAHNSSKELYKNRVAAIDYLQKRNRLSISKITNQKKFERQILVGKHYINFLSENLFGLTCGGTCNYMTAKYFQIPAAYSVLICTETEGLELFPKNTYITYDHLSLDKLYKEILYYEKNLKEAKNIAFTLSNYVHQEHNHLVRIKEIEEIMKSYL